MPSNITPQQIVNAIEKHLSPRKDLWHVVNGPKRETWFTAESIAALSNASPKSLKSGWRVYGEESCYRVSKHLEEFQVPHRCRKGAKGLKKIADITILENCTNSKAVLASIMEAKLISPSSTKKDHAAIPTSDAELQLKTLRNTKKDDGLLDQLDRARHLFPSAQVFGLIFLVHRTGQCEDVQPVHFYATMKTAIKSKFAGTSWQLWKDAIHQFAGQQKIKPIGGMFNSTASIAVAVIVESPSPKKTRKAMKTKKVKKPLRTRRGNKR